MILPLVLIINSSKHLFPSVIPVVSQHQLDHMGQTSGLLLALPAFTANLFLPLSSFQRGQTFVSLSIQVKTIFPGVQYNIMPQKLKAIYQELCLLPSCRMYMMNKWSFTFEGYSSMLQTSAPSKKFTDVAGLCSIYLPPSGGQMSCQDL